MIIKHANPCGVAVAGTIEEAYERALASDPVSAFGMVCAVNRPVSAALGEALAERFVDVLFAPDYDAQALESLQRKEAIRILHDRERRGFARGERDFKRVLGGLLVQDRDWDVDDREAMEVACGEPDEALLGRPRLRLARLQARRLERDRAREGPRDDRHRRRPDEPRRLRARSRSTRPASTVTTSTAPVLASDAFFPFADGPQAALDAGVTGSSSPGGAKRDDEVAEAVRTAGATMVLTGRRHFRH